MTVEQLTGALGDRYRIQRELGRQVAITVLRPEIARVLGAARFPNEIRTTAGLAHPHILPLHDSGQALEPGPSRKLP